MNGKRRALLSGTVLKERYILEKVSGEGNFGITYIGWDLLLESRVAVKEFFPINRVSRNAEQGETDVYVFQEEDYEQSLRRYLDEGKRLSKLNQIASIVSIRDFFYANRTAYIIMEYIEGVSLKTYIENNGPMAGTVVMDRMSPVLDALEQVHANGIIHRDISPDNIMVTNENQLILVDFGSARQVDGMQDKSLTVMVKRGYSSPEQYRSRGEQGAWSDVYAICATMYYMLTGTAPDEAIDRILDDETKSLLDMKEVLLSKAVKQAIMKGISLRYHERYQSVAELKAALMAADGRQLPARNSKQVKKATGYRGVFAAGAGVLALVVVVLAVRTFFHAEPALYGESLPVRQTTESMLSDRISEWETPREQTEELIHRKESVRETPVPSASPTATQKPASGGDSKNSGRNGSKSGRTYDGVVY